MRIVILSTIAVPALLSAQTDTTSMSAAYVFDSAAIVRSGARNLSEFLAGRVPHLVVRQTSGLAGAGSRVRIRGLNSFYATPNPLLIVDGVRVDATEGSLKVRAPAAPSRMDDFAIDDIARIEVFTGPAAAGRYGYGTAAGVIVVTTRVAQDSMATAWARVSGSTTSNTAEYPLSYRLYGVRTADGTATDNCPLIDVGSGLCQPTGIHRRRSLESGDFEGASRWAGTVGGSSTLRGARIRALAGHDRESGLLDPNTVARSRARLGVVSSLGDSGRVAVTAHHGVSTVDIPDDKALLGGLVHPASGEPSPDLVAFLARPDRADQRMRRSLVTIDLTGSLPASLRWRLQGGKEWLREWDQWVSGQTAYVIGAGGVVEEVTPSARTSRNHHSHTAIASVERHLSLPFQHARVALVASALRSSEAGTANDMFVSGWWHIPVNTKALALNYEGAFGSRAVITAGMRREGTRIRRKSFGNHDYTYGSATIGLGPRWLSRSDRAPLFRAVIRYGETATIPVIRRPIEDNVPFPLLPPDPMPERTFETEAGASLQAPRDLGAIGVTVFRRRTTGVTFPTLMPTSEGYRETLTSEMTARHHGIEIAGNVRPIRTEWLIAELAMVWGLNRTDSSSFDSPHIIARGIHPAEDDIAGVLGSAYGTSDTDGDGVIDPGEATRGSEMFFLGSRHPVRSLGTTAMIEIGRMMRVTAIFDYAGEFISNSETEYTRCVARTCRGGQDPASPPAMQARTVTNALNVYYQNASYTRLREVTASFEPRTGMFGHGARISLIGRNLALWTKFDGLDPEVSRNWDTVAGQSDWFVLPVPRSLMLRFDWQMR